MIACKTATNGGHQQKPQRQRKLKLKPSEAVTLIINKTVPVGQSCGAYAAAVEFPFPPPAPPPPPLQQWPRPLGGRKVAVVRPPPSPPPRPRPPPGCPRQWRERR